MKAGEFVQFGHIAHISGLKKEKRFHKIINLVSRWEFVVFMVFAGFTVKSAYEQFLMAWR